MFILQKTCFKRGEINTKIHHIGIVVKDLDKSVRIYSALGYILCNNEKQDNIQNNRVAFMKSPFSVDIELIEPIDKSSTVYNFEEGYHHICYEAEPEEDIIQRFKEMKIGKIFTPSIQAPALNNRKIVFACLQNNTFIEFIL